MRNNFFKILPYLLIVFLSSILFISCHHNGQKYNFVIHGTIDSAAGQMVYLTESDSNIVRVDSSRVDAKGRFMLHGYTPAESEFTLNFEKKMQTIFLAVNPKENITVKAFVNKPGNESVITGSPSSVELNSYISKLISIGKENHRYKMIMDSLYMVSASLSLIKETKAKLDSIHQEFIELESTTAATTHSPVVATFALSGMDYNHFYPSALMNELKNRFPNSRALQTSLKEIQFHLHPPGSKIVAGTLSPSFTLPNEQGIDISLAQYKGKAVLIDFWASWCGPCREGNKKLRKVYAKYHRSGLQFISVSSDKNKKSWINAINHDSLGWTNLWDSNEAITKLYDVEYIPQAFLIDPKGIVMAKGINEFNIDSILNTDLPKMKQ